MQTVQSFLEFASTLSDSKQLADMAYGGLTKKEREFLVAKGKTIYSGKVRDVISDQSEQCLILHSDRLTAFDCMIAMLPFKGVLLNAISHYWLSEAKKVVPTHWISTPHERMLRVEKAEPIRAEIVVRGYLAGSIDRAYAKGERQYCGVDLPEGLKSYSKLPRPIITPTTKAPVFEHDENISAEEVIRRGICSEKEWKKIETMALELFSFGQQEFERCGWILVDTKYEFGRNAKGEVIVIDEIHTPDSSRLWDAQSYSSNLAQYQPPKMLDKENVRRWLLSQGFSGHGKVPEVPNAVLLDLAKVYLEVAEKLIGQPIFSEGPMRSINLDLF